MEMIMIKKRVLVFGGSGLAGNAIKKEFEQCKNKDLRFLIRTDQRLHKLFCYRFWIINYLFCDGPLHRFYSEKLKEFAEKILLAQKNTDGFHSYPPRETIFADDDLTEITNWLHGI
jgi:hypothetical protein